jgi:hypothetical protein
LIFFSYRSALSRSSCASSASSNDGTIKRAIKNCDWALRVDSLCPPPIPAASPPPITPRNPLPPVKHARAPPILDDAAAANGNGFDDVPIVLALNVITELGCCDEVPMPLAFGVDVTTGCVRRGSRSSCWRAAYEKGKKNKNIIPLLLFFVSKKKKKRKDWEKFK